MQLKLTLEKSYKNIFNFLKFNMLYIAIIKRNIIYQVLKYYERINKIRKN